MGKENKRFLLSNVLLRLSVCNIVQEDEKHRCDICFHYVLLFGDTLLKNESNFAFLVRK